MIKMEIKLNIANSQKIFSEEDCKKIKNGIMRAKEYAAPKLKIAEDIDIVVTPDLQDFLIPEDHLGAFTYNGNFIIISFAKGHVNEALVYEVTCHELCHAARWQKNKEDMKNLFDGMILEGLAVCFEEQAVKNQKNKQFFLQTMLERSDQENAEILKHVGNDLDKNRYDYFTFENKERNIPRWTGYSVGYYLVKKYLAKTEKTIDEIFAEPFDNFRIILQ